MLSMDTFLAHPLLGVGPCTLADNPCLFTVVGGHSTWIDQLAEYGVVGFGFFICFVLSGLRQVARKLKQQRNDLIIRGCVVSCVLYLVAGVVNPVLWTDSISALFYFVVLGSAAGTATGRCSDLYGRMAPGADTATRGSRSSAHLGAGRQM
jgi:O-antigen ligase